MQAIGALLLVGGVLLGWIVFHEQHAHAAIREGRWAATLRHIVEGVHLMGNRRTMGWTAAISLLYLAVQVVSVWALMKAYGLDLSFWAAGGVLTLVRFATVVPNAPGNVGLFQVACVLALGLFNVETNDAKTFSFIMFFALTLPLLVGGAVAVALTGVNIAELRDRAHHGLHVARTRKTRRSPKPMRIVVLVGLPDTANPRGSSGTAAAALSSDAIRKLLADDGDQPEHPRPRLPDPPLPAAATPGDRPRGDPHRRHQPDSRRAPPLHRHRPGLRLRSGGGLLRRAAGGLPRAQRAPPPRRAG